MVYILSTSIYAQEEKENFGWVQIHTNLEKFYLVVDNDYQNSYFLTSGDSLKLPIYGHELRIVWRNINDYVTLVDIPLNKTVLKRINFAQFTSYPKSSYQILESRQNVSISTDNNSEIFIDGESVGTQYAELFLNPGKYDLSIINPEFGSLEKTVNVSYHEFTSVARYNENPNPIPAFAKLIPGLSYLSTKQSKKAIITYSGLALLSGTALYFNSEYNKKNDLFQLQNEEYLAATSTEEAILKRNIAKGTISDMESINEKINIATISAIAFYAITTIDGFRKPKGGYKGPDFLNPQFGLNRNSLNGNLFAEIGFMKRF
tara:strand:+ start:11053 stop:12006 length:954 start_codon:yes stop_codon:yes gene_type:complete